MRADVSRENPFLPQIEGHFLVSPDYKRFRCYIHLLASRESADNLTALTMMTPLATHTRPADALDQRECPRISVVVCAYNAAAFLSDCIDSVMEQITPTDQYEVLLIDNNSEDNSRDVIRDLKEAYGSRLKVLTELRPGLSAARNRALAEADSQLIAFVDADAIVEPNWLSSLLAAFDAHPSAAVVGGRIEVQWDAPKPVWWDHRLDEAMGHFSPHDKHCVLLYPQFPYGGNFAVRADAVRAVGNFEVKLGRKGEKLLAGEEGELCLRLVKAKWEIHYTPAAVIHHRATAGRLTRRFILRRAFNHGRSQYLLESLHSFESGLYLSWPGMLWSFVRNGFRLNWNMPYFKFILFRVGYQYQRLRSRPS